MEHELLPELVLVRETGTYVSLVLGITAIYLMCEVMRVYWPQFRAAWQNSERGPVDFLLLGVAVGFIGGIGDGAYWQITWSADWWEWVVAQYLIYFGPLPNIGFRQVCDIGASILHLMGAFVRGDADLRNIMIRAMMFTMGAVVLYGTTGG